MWKENICWVPYSDKTRVINMSIKVIRNHMHLYPLKTGAAQHMIFLNNVKIY